LVYDAIALDDHPELVADACSLQREQVEKVFEILLLKSDPRRWVIRFFRNSWKAHYEELLHAQEEKLALDRYRPFLTNLGPDTIDRMRSLPAEPGKRPTTIVSVRAMKGVKVRYLLRRDSSAPRPRWYDGRWMDKYFEWPLPGRYEEKIRDSAAKNRFHRWYLEYKTACDYTHVGARKLLVHALSRDKSMEGGQRVETATTKLAEEALFVSYLASLAAVSEAMDLLDDPRYVRRRAEEFWQQVVEMSLLARALWTDYEPLFH